MQNEPCGHCSLPDSTLLIRCTKINLPGIKVTTNKDNTTNRRSSSIKKSLASDYSKPVAFSLKTGYQSGAGWDKLKQIKMEYNFTDGRVIVRGNVTARGKRKRTDYLLYYKPNIPLAIVEAKDNKHSIHNAIISHPALPGTFCAVLP